MDEIFKTFVFLKRTETTSAAFIALVVLFHFTLANFINWN